MNKLTAAILSILALGTGVSAAAASTSWISQIGGKGAEVAADVIETSDQRVCATGTFWSTAEFGHGEQAVTLHTPEAQDIFIACYHANGDLQYAKQFGASRGDEPRALAALPNGDVLMTGLFTESLGTEPNSTLKANGNSEMFLTRLNQKGDVVWSKQFGGKLADSAKALAVSDAGDIVMAGSFEGLMTYTIGDKVPKVNSFGARDAIVMKLNLDGELQWVSQVGGKGYDEAAAVTIRPDGSVIVAGTFQQIVRIGKTTLQSRGNKDVYVQALDSNGEDLWVQHFGGAYQDNVSGVVVDSQERIHVAGDFQKSLILSPQKTLVSVGSTDVYIARLTSDGELTQANRIGGKQIDQVFAMSVTADDGLLLAGHYQGSFDAAPGDLEVLLHSPSASNSSGYLLALDEHGDHAGSLTLGGLGVEMALGLSPQKNGNVAVVGLFNNDFTVSPLTALENRGKTDMYVISVTVPETERLSQNITSSD